MRWGLALVLALLAAPTWAGGDEARQWTENLRRYDRFAKVLRFEDWERRNGPDPLNVTLRIADGTATVRIRSFESSTTCRDARLALKEAESRGGRRILLDLSGNPGGQRMMAVCVAGLFVGPRVIFGVRDILSPIPDLSQWIESVNEPAGTGLTWQSSVTDQVTSLPVNVRIDRHTASAAELVAGVLQEYGRARVEGEKSFGKGSVQDCSPLRDRPELVLCHTVQRVYLPSGRPLDEGVTPNDFGHGPP